MSACMYDILLIVSQRKTYKKNLGWAQEYGPHQNSASVRCAHTLAICIKIYLPLRAFHIDRVISLINLRYKIQLECSKGTAAQIKMASNEFVAFV